MLNVDNSHCQACGLCNGRTHVVNGAGNPQAKILLITDAPGAEDDKAGRLFSDERGRLLRKFLSQAQIPLEDIYVTTAVRCRTFAPPPLNTRPPTWAETVACFPYLEQEIQAIKPTVIVPLGNVSLRSLLQQKSAKITEYEGREIIYPKYNCKIFAIQNPGAVMKQPAKEALVAGHFQLLKRVYHTKEVVLKAQGNYKTLTSIEEVRDVLETLKTKDVFAFDIETNSLNPRAAKVLCLSLSWIAEQGVVIPLQRYIPETYNITVIKKKKRRKKLKTGETQVLEDEVPTIEERIRDTYTPFWGEQQQAVEALVRQILVLPALKVAHNGKFDTSCLLESGFTTTNFNFDTMLADFLLDENRVGRHNLKDCAGDFVGMGNYDAPVEEWFHVRHISNENRNYAHLPPELLYKYAAMDADATLRLYVYYVERLQKDGLTEFLYRLIMPLSHTLARAERRGFCIDIDRLHEVRKVLEQEQVELTKKIEEFAPGVNVNSTLQLRELLFNKLKLRSSQKTPSGALATDEDVLLELGKQHALPALILQNRHLQKTLNTYVIGLEERIDPIDNKVHTSFLIHGTVTGRLASRDPNLQNMPSDGHIKSIFIPTYGWIYLEADYGQAEFRVWGNYSRDPQLIKDIIAATNGTGPDIHILTASRVRGIRPDQVTPLMRKQAKGTVFGLMYGRSTRSIAEEYGISEEEAEATVRAFFSRYPIAKAWLNGAKATVRQYGQIRNLFGRLRRLPGINSSDDRIRADAERQAINSPIQSAASDLNCNATNRIGPALTQRGLSGELLLLVHDSLLYETPIQESIETLNIMKTEMERPVLDTVAPMQAEFKVGFRWGSLTDIVPKSDGWYIQREVTEGDTTTLVEEKFIPGQTNV